MDQYNINTSNTIILVFDIYYYPVKFLFINNLIKLVLKHNICSSILKINER